MKKILHGILAICLCIMLMAASGCKAPMSMSSIGKEPHFSGVVTEIYDKSILVSVDEGEQARRSSDLISVPIQAELKDSATEFTVGDEVTVYYDGTIMESYPAQLAAVYAIIVTGHREQAITAAPAAAWESCLRVSIRSPQAAR